MGDQQAGITSPVVKALEDLLVFDGRTLMTAELDTLVEETIDWAHVRYSPTNSTPSTLCFSVPRASITPRRLSRPQRPMPNNLTGTHTVSLPQTPIRAGHAHTADDEPALP